MSVNPKLEITYDTSQKIGHVSGQITEINNIIGKNVVHVTPPEEKPPRIPSQLWGVEDSVTWFEGRKTELDDLHKLILDSKGKPNAASYVNIIYGVAGVGKTNFVRNYIQRHKKEYDHILWIKAETTDHARNCFLKLADESHIDISGTDCNGKLVSDKEIVEKIYNSPAIGRSLFVFDNLEDEEKCQEESIRNFLPSAIQADRIPPTIIVTTRHPNWDDYSSIPLKGLTKDACYELLVSKLKIEKNDRNQELAFEINERFEGHPLSLEQVICMINDEDGKRKLSGGRYRLQNFLYEWKKGETFKETPSLSVVRDNICRLYDVAIQKLKRKAHGRLAVNCLDIMAILDPDEIPRTLLTSLIGDVNQDSLLAAITLLENSCLITCSDSAYKIHRVLQVVRKQASSFTVSILPTLLFLPLKPFQKFNGKIHISSLFNQYFKYSKTLDFSENYNNSTLRNGLQLYKYCVKKYVNYRTCMYKFENRLALQLTLAGMHSEVQRIYWNQRSAGYSRRRLLSIEDPFGDPFRDTFRAPDPIRVPDPFRAPDPFRDLSEDRSRERNYHEFEIKLQDNDSLKGLFMM